MCIRWVLTVASEMNSWAAVSRLLAPWATSSSTSSSRWLIGSWDLEVTRYSGSPVAVVLDDDPLHRGGTDRITMHEDALVPGQRVLLVDDLIATGGTARAAVRLLRKAGATVDQAQFVIDLPDLGGAAALEADGIKVTSLFAFEGH